MALLTVGCGSEGLAPFSPLTERQPFVVSVTPADSATAAGDAPVEITFSKPVLSSTVARTTFFVTAVPEGEVDTSLLLDQVSAQNQPVVKGNYEMLDGGLRARFYPSTNYPPGVRYAVVVTPQVFSVEKIPLNQTPGKNPTPFLSSFYAGPAGSAAGEMAQSQALVPLRPSYLQLNEVFYDAVGVDSAGPLFVELLGESEKEIGGYKITFVRGDDGEISTTIVIPQGSKINADGFFVIGRANVSQASWVKEIDPPNGPNCVQLLDPAGNLVDALGYGAPLVANAKNGLACYESTPALDAPAGSSLSRRSGEADTNDNAKDWMINAHPSPGGLEN